MAGLVRKSYGVLVLACVVLLATATSARADGEVRDHRKQSGQPEVRDHRKPNRVPAPSDADKALITALMKAADAALKGPDVRDLKVNGHLFTVKKAKTSNYNGTFIITGQISHHLAKRPDDQVYYTINKRGDGLSLASMNIQRGGVGLIASYPGKLAGKIYGRRMTTSLEEACTGIGNLIDGSWESSADLIVAAIGVRSRAWSPGGTITPSGGTPVSGPTGGVVRDHRAQ